MTFNDTTNHLGIIQGCEDYCNLGDNGISGNTNLLKSFTRYVNIAQSKIWSWIFASYGGWQWDDDNQTNLPRATQNLTSGTSSYALPTDALTIKGVEVLDANGDWRLLSPMTDETIRESEAIGEFPGSTGLINNGTPRFYEPLGLTLKIWPTPNYSSTNGLKVFFDRGTVSFASTDTTKAPGFASEFHNALAVGASMEWMKPNKSSSAVLKNLAVDWQRYEVDITDFYTQRYSQLKVPRLKARGRRISFR